MYRRKGGVGRGGEGGHLEYMRLVSAPSSKGHVADAA